mmetsp:Transcript_32328/g.76811  ORF Transcript_32328/g.76811 Transcript_32328/m.76811 type:complete len:143 (-) Transcript_32328:93-521(-)
MTDVRKPGIRWDEPNLTYNDENRCATMKIDEPPTPYNFDYCDDEVEDRDDQERAAAEHKMQEEERGAAARPQATFADQWQAAGLTEAMQDVDELEPSVLEDSDEAKAARKLAFEANRKKHYGMQQALAKGAEDDEEDEEDEK